MTKRYTQNQIGFLRAGYQSMNARGLARAFNAEFGTDKTESAIKATLCNHKIRCGRKPKDRIVECRQTVYTEEHAQFLQANYSGHTVRELTKLFNDRFGMNKTDIQIKAFISRKGIISGRDGRFKKGNAPWNVGTKGQGLTGPNKGSFKKGHIPGNTKPLGDERIDPKDGYILVKVAEKNPYTGASTRYKHKHVHIWEQENGPAPDGMVVIFRDGDKRNFDPDNLVLITRSELVRLNQSGYKDIPAELKPSFLTMIQLKVKTFERINLMG